MDMSNQEILESLKRTRENMLQNIKHLDGVIALYSKDEDALRIAQNSGMADAVIQGYLPSLPTKQKIALILKSKKRFLHSREIVGAIIEFDESIEDAESITNKVSQALSALKNEGVVVNVKINKQNINTFWGSPKWLDENDQINPQFIYDNAQVFENKPVEI